MHDSRFGMPAFAVGSGQRCFKTEMRGRFRCFAAGGGREGPGNKDNHGSFPCEWVLVQIILKAVHGDSLS